MNFPHWHHPWFLLTHDILLTLLLNNWFTMVLQTKTWLLQYSWVLRIILVVSQKNTLVDEWVEIGLVEVELFFLEVLFLFQKHWYLFLFFIFVLVWNVNLATWTVSTYTFLLLLLNLLFAFYQQFSDVLLQYWSENEVSNCDTVIFELVDSICTLLNYICHHFLGYALDESFGDQLKSLPGWYRLINGVDCLRNNPLPNFSANNLRNHTFTNFVHCFFHYCLFYLVLLFSPFQSWFWWSFQCSWSNTRHL